MTDPVEPARIHLKRIYEPAASADGTRVLVERLWPRGVSKAEARLDEWTRDLAPSTDLRRWYGHDPARWAEFRKRYRHELANREDDLNRLRALAGRKTLTLVYAARDRERNSAVVLRKALENE